ncbi:MAG: glycosidase [Saprospiraceae bacterium]|nr:MAG: glycosidase [Saprospiraceae bacterium]
MQIKRSDIRIHADAKKVIVNYLNLGIPAVSKRIGTLINRVLALDEEEVTRLYQDIQKEFGHRHLNFDYYLNAHFEQIQTAISQDVVLTPTRKKLLGAYFTKEYSIRSAALFNPSMIAHPDQSGLSAGEKRFIISLRAVGEGHISSIEFRSGIVDAAGQIQLDEDAGFAACAVPDNSKIFNVNKLKKRTVVLAEFNQNILDEFGPTFTKKDYLNAPAASFSHYDKNTQDQLDQILDTNYDVLALPGSALSERIVFPSAKQESKGMEDVRLVEFIENGKSTYIGTYTAYNGLRISPQLIITEDFMRFKIRTMYGKAVNDKGFALFPEKINGKFVMLGRQGGENISLMYSDDLFIWETYETLMTPDSAWGLIQLGNCGSPIKTEEGWLVITHAVGAMRKYVISAILLDLTNPAKIIKKLSQPLLSPNEAEREGYVPNVVYSCGSMVHGNLLIIPYAMSDSASTFSTVDIQELLDNMS